MTTVQSQSNKKTLAELEEYAIVKRQLNSCYSKPHFFDDFYADFTAQSPEIAAAFAKTDMQAQKDALRKGLSFLIMYAEGSGVAGSKLDRLGGTHSRTGYNIRPQLYAVWIDSLVRTVKKYIPENDWAAEKAWRHILQLGVNRIQSWY